MIYLYDKAICADLQESFNPGNANNPIVKVITSEEAVGLVAQIKSDEVQLPVVVLTRSQDVQVDTDRSNFTQTHKGVVSVIDPETNELFYERAIPIKLKYGLTLLTSRVADTDELVRELMFKYSSMYFISMETPYEANRKVRFGITVDRDEPIERRSSVDTHYAEGKLYETIIPLKCDGCVLLSYTPAKIQRTEFEVNESDIKVAKPTQDKFKKKESRRKGAAQNVTSPTYIRPQPSKTEVEYDTTENWDKQLGLIAKRGVIYVYSNHVFKDGEWIPGLKVGNGKSYLIDLPFTDEANVKSVVVTPILTTGELIATITVDGVESQIYAGIHTDSKVMYGTTAYWNSQPSLISQEGCIYIYSDHDAENNIPGMKVGNGRSYLLDLPFVDQEYAKHIINDNIHVTPEEKEFWNNKVRCYADGNHIIFTTH